MSSRLCYVLAVSIFVSVPALSQDVHLEYLPGDLGDTAITRLKKEFGANKQWPADYEKAILIALSHYPELKSTSIRFVARANHSPGFTRVTWGGLFEPPVQRHFLVVISDSTEPMLAPLLFKKLPFNAQVAAVGHELAHVADFLNKTSLEIIQHAFNNVSRRYVDRFEFNTDAIAIDHGLGFQLLAWSSYVREKMRTINWDGPDLAHKKKRRERYMNPSTIWQKMAASPLYRQFSFVPPAGQ